MAYNEGVTRDSILNQGKALVYDPTNTYNTVVHECQVMLSRLENKNGAYYYTGSLDGRFGTGMRNAVLSFQQENVYACGTPDGKVGKNTLTALDIAYEHRSDYNAYGSEVSASYLMDNRISEISLLARLIYAENTTSSQGRCNIAHVVYNRKQSSKFPNTYHGVAQDENQWTVICNGHENARKPPRTTDAWMHALGLAKKLSAGSGLPGVLGSTLTKGQLYARKDGTEPSGAKDIVRVGRTVFYNL